MMSEDSKEILLDEMRVIAGEPGTPLRPVLSGKRDPNAAEWLAMSDEQRKAYLDQLRTYPQIHPDVWYRLPAELLLSNGDILRSLLTDRIEQYQKRIAQLEALRNDLPADVSDETCELLKQMLEES